MTAFKTKRLSDTLCQITYCDVISVFEFYNLIPNQLWTHRFDRASQVQLLRANYKELVFQTREGEWCSLLLPSPPTIPPHHYRALLPPFVHFITFFLEPTFGFCSCKRRTCTKGEWPLLPSSPTLPPPPLLMWRRRRQNQRQRWLDSVLVSNSNLIFLIPIFNYCDPVP